MFPNKKLMSMYLHHIIGFSSKALRIFTSKSDINKITYGGENCVVIAVPRVCLKVFSSNSIMRFFSNISVSSIRVSLEICLSSVNSNALNQRIGKGTRVV